MKKDRFWTKEKNYEYEKWKSSMDSGDVIFIEEEDYDAFENRYIQESDINEEQEINKEPIKDELDIPEKQKTRSESRLFSIWLIFFIFFGIGTDFLNRNWTTVQQNFTTFNNILNGTISESKKGNRKRS